MILQALTAYYEAMAAKGAIAKPGRSQVRIGYALDLGEQGELRGILPLESTDEKGKTVPRYFDMPAPVKRTVGISPNFLWDNSTYLLGVDQKNNPERAKNCFAAAGAFHKNLLESVRGDAFAQAICQFWDKWNPDRAAEDLILAPAYAEVTAGGNLTFAFRGQLPDRYDLFDRVWQAAQEPEAGGEKMRCLVTGDLTVPEKVHPSIKKVYGAQSSGAALVSFNAPAFCSYNREQNLNAPISHYAAFAYTTALNQLLSDGDHTRRFGDTTVVYWAEDAQTQYQDLFSCFLDGDTITQQDLTGVMDALCAGKSCDWNALPIHPENHFYVLGLAPNAARISVRFFIQDSFGALAEHFRQHFERLRIVRPAFDRDENLPLWRLLRETVNPNSRDKAASPQMAGDTLRAILTGGRYPATLYQQTMLRIKAERDVTRGKAAIIKAYLIRNGNDPDYKEALTVELNAQTQYLPYLLGRLFSVLEDLQLQANPGINTTIKDKYFTSACTTPAVVFPTLLKLAEKHLRKLDDRLRIYYSKQMGSILAAVTESYPAHLSLSDQGIFQLGYYHQTQKRYSKSETEKK